MRLRSLAFATATAAVATAAAYVAMLSGDGPSQPTASAAPARVMRASTGRPAPGRVARAHYRLAYQQQVTVPGQAPVTVRAEGAWIATPRADGRTEVRFEPATLDGPAAELPRAEDLAGAAQLVSEDGVLTAIGFPEAMPRTARKLLTGLATTFQLSTRAGAEWTIAEEDMSGRYEALYRRAGDAVERGRARYTAVRGEAGLSAASADGVTPAERTTFRVDADGVVSAAVELDVAFAVGSGVAPVQLVLRASLERASIEHVAPADGEAFAAAPISGHADFEGARRNADRSLVAGATVADLVAEVRRAVALPGRDGGNRRAQALARLAALVRLEPGAAEEIAGEIREHPEAVAEARVLAGALASARVAAGTDALAGLAGLAGDELPEATRGAIVGALSFANPVTPASLAALSAGIDRPHGNQAALGLGTHGRKARATDPAAAAEAVALLLDRHARAGTSTERRLYLEALGNAGAVRALPVLRAAIERGDRNLGSAAAFSLRFVPGADVDDLLEESIARPELALAAIRATGYRDPARWRARLLAAQEEYAGHDGIQGEIRAILQRWR